MSSSGDVRRPDVLVIGTSVDPHVAAVLERLPADLSVCRLDVDLFPRSHRLTVQPGHQPKVSLETSSGIWILDEVPVAWFRRLGQPGLDPGVPEHHRAFVLGEVEQTLTGALSLLAPRQWVNEYWSARRAAVKLFQYEAILSVGIPFAETIVSNSAPAVRRWRENRGEIVYKSLNSPLLDEGDSESGRVFVFTSVATQADLRDGGSIALAPCQFQRQLTPAFELRVTTIGSRHLAVRIDHEPWPEGDATDWRAHPNRLRSSPYDLPDAVAAQLSALMRLLNLEYGASDWMVDDRGEHILLEVNPHGAWLWLEREVEGLGITEAIAETLTRFAIDGINYAVAGSS